MPDQDATRRQDVDPLAGAVMYTLIEAQKALTIEQVCRKAERKPEERAEVEAALRVLVADKLARKQDGALGGIVVFLVWITNTVILLGAELNAEIERGRQIQAGAPADREPFLEPRDEPS